MYRGGRLRLPAEQLRLGVPELLVGNGATVPEVAELAELVGRTGAGSCGLPDVLAERLLAALRPGQGALVHRAPARNQVDEGAEPRQEDEEHRPERLAPPRQLVVAEEVAEDPEQQHDPREQDHEPEDGPHHAPEIHVPLLSTRVVHTALGATPPVMGQPSPGRRRPASPASGEVASAMLAHRARRPASVRPASGPPVARVSKSASVRAWEVAAVPVELAV